MKQLTSRQMQAINTKNKLLDISIGLVRKHGFDSVSIQQICKEAGVSTGAFYHHIQSKANIVVEIYKQCDDYFEHEVINNLQSEDPIERIIEYIGYQMRYGEDSGIDLIIQVYKAQITEGNRFFLSDDRGLPKGLYKLIRQAQEKGAISKSLPYSEIGNEILLLARGVIYNWCQCEGSYPLIPKGQEMVRKFLKSYML